MMWTLLWCLLTAQATPPSLAQVEIALASAEQGLPGSLDELGALAPTLRQELEGDDDAGGWRALGLAEFHLGRDAEARAALERAIELDPSDAEAHTYLAGLLGMAGEHQAAGEAWLRVLAVDPNSDVALYNAGQAFQSAGAFARALECFDGVVAADPSDFRALEKRVQLLQALGELPQRDAALAALMALYASGTVPEMASRGYFVRDQFAHQDIQLLVYAFYSPGPGDPLAVALMWDDQQYQLGAFELRAARGGEGYELGMVVSSGTDWTYRHYAERPSYDTARADILAVMNGDVEPVGEPVALEP